MSTHFRIIEDGTESGQRVLTRQVKDASGERHMEVLDSADWRRLKPNEQLRARVDERHLPQVSEQDWVA